MFVCCEEVGFSLPPELSFRSVYFVFSSLLSCTMFFRLLQQYCCWPFLQQKYHQSWSLPEQCDRVSHHLYNQELGQFLHRKPTVFGFPHALSSVPALGSLVLLNPVFHLLLAPVTCFFSAIFSAQLCLISYALPNFPSILALQAVKNVSSKLDQELFSFLLHFS